MDSRGTTFHTIVSDPGQAPALLAFEDWCLENLPPPGDEWSRFDHDVLDPFGRPVGRRIVLVFSDATHARRFRDRWL